MTDLYADRRQLLVKDAPDQLGHTVSPMSRRTLLCPTTRDLDAIPADIKLIGTVIEVPVEDLPALWARDRDDRPLPNDRVERSQYSLNVLIMLKR